VKFQLPFSISPVDKKLSALLHIRLRYGHAAADGRVAVQKNFRSELL
jgi:hypothetical protein